MCEPSIDCTITSLISSGSYNSTYGTYGVIKVKSFGGTAGAGGCGLVVMIVCIWFFCRGRETQGSVVAVHHPGEKHVEEVTTTHVEEVVTAHTYDDGMPEPGF